jgi:hypothetical protein
MLMLQQASLALASAPGISDGLQPRSELAGQEVNTGGSVSTIYVNTCVQVAVLPQASVAV